MAEAMWQSTPDQVLALLADGGPCTAGGLARELERSYRTVHKALRRLERRSVVRANRAGRYVVWEATTIGRAAEDAWP